MNGGTTYLDRVTVELRDRTTDRRLVLAIDIFDNRLNRKWLTSLNDLLANNYHLEKNYCFLGFADSDRSGSFICDQINASIAAINSAGIGYHISDHFDIDTCLLPGAVGFGLPGQTIDHQRFNRLHRYFEDLQGVSGKLSDHYATADAETRWHIRQLNLLCHEFETWAMSHHKKILVPEWQRPSQLMCWLQAPRFTIEPEDYEFFGIETLIRPTGAVFLGVNKAIGKHHWEVFNDEGSDSRIGELTTSTLRAQSEAAGDFDIEWGQGTARHEFMQNKLQQFSQWLSRNGFDPDDPALTLGHPQVGQIDLMQAFGSEDIFYIWGVLNNYLDVSSVKTSDASCEYHYHWSDADYKLQQIAVIERSRA